jgi:hypothetical protein
VFSVLALPTAGAVLGVAGGLVVAFGVSTGAVGLAASVVTAEALYCTVIVATFRGPLIDLIGIVGRAVRPLTASP